MTRKVGNISARRRGQAAALVEEEDNRNARQAYELRKRGKSWFAIAEDLQLPESKVRHLANEAMRQAAELVSEGAKRSLLAMELDRLDALQDAYWDDATRAPFADADGHWHFPDVKAGEFILKVMAQRAKLLGLDSIPDAAIAATTVIVGGNSEEYISALAKLAGRTIPGEVVEDSA